MYIFTFPRRLCKIIVKTILEEELYLKHTALSPFLCAGPMWSNAEISRYKEVQQEIQNLKVSESIGWLKIDSKPIKQTSKWLVVCLASDKMYLDE